MGVCRSPLRYGTRLPPRPIGRPGSPLEGERGGSERPAKTAPTQRHALSQGSLGDITAIRPITGLCGEPCPLGLALGGRRGNYPKLQPSVSLPGYHEREGGKRGYVCVRGASTSTPSRWLG